MKHIGTLAGAAVGALVGGAVWTGVAWLTGYELGILAAGLGITCGIGAAIGAKGYAGTAGGIIAAATAMIAIVVSRGVIVQLQLDEYLSEAIAENGEAIPGPENNEYWVAFIADQIIEREEQAGATINWPDFDEDNDSVAAQYPADIWQQSLSHWNGFSASQQAEFCTAGRAYVNKQTAEDAQAFRGVAGLIGMLWVNFHPMSLVLMGIACFGAFRIAKNSRPVNEANELTTFESTTSTPNTVGETAVRTSLPATSANPDSRTIHGAPVVKLPPTMSAANPVSPGSATPPPPSDEPWLPPWMRKQ